MDTKSKDGMSILFKIKELEKRDTVFRDEIQYLCKEIEGNCLLFWCPRVGKTNAALNMINPDQKVLVCSNRIIIQKNWIKYFEQRGLTLCKSICYQSLHKELNEYDVIICDEADILSPNYFEILSNFTPQKWIGLTGTPTYRLRQLWYKHIGKTFQWTITFNQAIKWGILPVPEVICLGLNLKNDKRYLLYHKGKDKKKKSDIVTYNSPAFWSSIKDKSVNTIVQCTEVEWFQMIERDIQYWKDQDDDKLLPMIISNNINRLGNERKKMFAELKNRFIKKTITYFGLEDKRLLIFCNSIPQAEFLDGSFAVHSGKKTTYLIDEFNEGKINRLLSIGILDRGIDIINIDACIMIQVGNSSASNSQKSSRPLLDNSPKLILLYYKGTRDEEYVKKFVSQFKPEYVKWLSPY